MKNNKYLIFIAIGALAVSGYLFYKQSVGVREYRLPYPFTRDVSTNTTFNCEAQIAATLEANKDSVSGEKDGIKASLTEGTDQVVINVKEDTVEFLTKASFEAGITDGASFQKLRDDSEYLIAAMNFKDNSGVDTFVIEKKTGLSTWTRNAVTAFITNHPDIQAYYLLCR